MAHKTLEVGQITGRLLLNVLLLLIAGSIAFPPHLSALEITFIIIGSVIRATDSVNTTFTPIAVEVPPCVTALRPISQQGTNSIRVFLAFVPRLTSTQAFVIVVFPVGAANDEFLVAALRAFVYLGDTGLTGAVPRMTQLLLITPKSTHVDIVLPVCPAYWLEHL